MERRFHLSSLEVRRKDGQVFFVPWDEVRVVDSWLYVPAAAVPGRRWFGLGGCVGARAGKVALRLHRRAAWRNGRWRIKCPRLRWVLAFQGCWLILGMVLASAPLWVPRNHKLTDIVRELGALPPGVQAVVALVGVLWVVGILLYTGLPIVAAWPYTVFRWRHPDLIELRALPEALVYCRRDGRDTRLRWDDLESFTGAGRLSFANYAESPIVIYTVENRPWDRVYNQLKSRYPQAYVSSPTPGQCVREVCVVMITAVIAEVLAAVATRWLEVQHNAPAGFFLLFGAASSLLLSTRLWPTLAKRAQRSENARK